MIPGEIFCSDEEIIINNEAETIKLLVSNSGDRPIQIGSHYHFAEVNSALLFDRALTRGFRLNIIAGTAIRFEPGQTKEVYLVPFGGNRKVYGFNEVVMGDI